MSDIMTLYSIRPHDLTDEEIDRIIADLRAKRHAFNTAAKVAAGAKPKAGAKAGAKPKAGTKPNRDVDYFDF